MPEGASNCTDDDSRTQCVHVSWPPQQPTRTPVPLVDGTVLGFDVGARRIGVGIGSALAADARALAVINVHAGRIDWPAVDRLHRDWMPAALVVGDPMTLDGGDQPIRHAAREFAHELHSRYRLPVWMIDERSSSIEAARRFAAGRAAGQRRRREAAQLDAIAAAVIIERWLAAPADATLIHLNDGAFAVCANNLMPKAACATC